MGGHFLKHWEFENIFILTLNWVRIIFSFNCKGMALFSSYFSFVLEVSNVILISDLLFMTCFTFRKTLGFFFLYSYSESLWWYAIIWIFIILGTFHGKKFKFQHFKIFSLGSFRVFYTHYFRNARNKGSDWGFHSSVWRFSLHTMFSSLPLSPVLLNARYPLVLIKTLLSWDMRKGLYLSFTVLDTFNWWISYRFCMVINYISRSHYNHWDGNPTNSVLIPLSNVQLQKIYWNLPYVIVPSPIL